MTASFLRDYQVAGVDRIAAEIAAGRRRVLYVAPTGSGKTVVAAEIINRAVQAGHRVLFLAHRRELIQQAVAKLFAVGIDAGIIQAGFPPRPAERVQIASISTLHSRAVRSSAMDAPPAEVVIVDEAHHIRARTYRQILELYPNAIVIGLTATPCRGDGRGLGKSFDVLVEGPDVAALTAAGYLVPARIFAPTRPNLDGVAIQRGEYAEGQLAERVDQPELVGDIVLHWLKLAERRPTVIFATGVGHALHIRDEFRRANVLAEEIDGSTPADERDAILAGLAASRVELVANAMVLTEGWDCPQVSCLVLARPTRSLGLFRQMVGRTLRPAPGKTDALILDHAGAVFAHGFPDDPIYWTLREDRRAENAAHAARGTSRAPALTDCPECHAVKFEGRPCAVCGWRPRRRAEAVEVAEGDLIAFDPAGRRCGGAFADPADRHRFHAMLAYIARERGYRPGWAGHKYKEKFGVWPQARFVDPIRPDDATRSWVKSRVIAFAKATQKAAGVA